MRDIHTILSDWFMPFRENVITIIGSGGKTSLLWFLARVFSENPPGGSSAGKRRVLVTTSTKMGAPGSGSPLFDRFINGADNADGAGLDGGTLFPGVTFAGVHPDGSTKTTPLPAGMFSRLIAAADTTLIEGDGSKTLPLKGWADYEPVVPEETTLTIGVIPVWPIGKPVSAALIHRLPLFCALTGAREGELLTPHHIVQAVCPAWPEEPEGNRPAGLFARARGRRLLYFSQIEDEADLANAYLVTSRLPPAFRASLAAIAAGSVHTNRGVTY